MLTATFESLALAALAVVIGLILPEPTRKISQAIHDEPLVAGGVGLLTIVGSPILLVLLIVTLILIPVAVVWVIALGLAILFGWIALGHEIGERISKMGKVVWSVPVAGGIGVLILSLLVGLIGLIPCIGWIVAFLFSMLGLGAVVMTRFGSMSSTPKPKATTMVPPPPPSPTEPPQITSAN